MHLPKEMMRIVLFGVGLSSIAALVYLAGPLVSIGGRHPLENYIVREIVILLLVSAFAAVTSIWSSWFTRPTCCFRPPCSAANLICCARVSWMRLIWC